MFTHSLPNLAYIAVLLGMILFIFAGAQRKERRCRQSQPPSPSASIRFRAGWF